MPVKEYLIRLGLFVVGLLLQAIFPSSVIALIISGLMILASTYKLYDDKEERIYADPGDKNAGSWVPFPDDKLKELLSYIKPADSTTPGASSNSLSSTTMLIIIGIAAVSSGFILNLVLLGSLFESFGLYQFCFDAILIIYTLYAFLGGNPPPHPMAIQAYPLDAMQCMALSDGFEKQFEAHIVKDKNGDPDILEARLQIRPKNKIKGLLCMMITINRTNVQSVIYPYAYGVIVFKGTAMSMRSTRTSDGINKLTNRTKFKCDIKTQENDSVFVILPASARQYTTDYRDCVQLCEIMTRACDIIANNRNEIESMS